MPLAETPKPTPVGNAEWFLYWILEELQSIREILEQSTGYGILYDSDNNPFLDSNGQELLDGA